MKRKRLLKTALFGLGAILVVACSGGDTGGGTGDTGGGTGDTGGGTGDTGGGGTGTPPGEPPAIIKTKVTGGGWLSSKGVGVEGASLTSGKANVGFVINNCEDTGIKGHYVYHDFDNPGVAIKAKSKVTEVLGANPCPTITCGGAADVAFFETTYINQNKKETDGTGGNVCVCISASTQNIGLEFVSGAFAGYSNEGQLKGNITNHGCDE